VNVALDATDQPDVGIGVHDNGIFAAHLKHRALDPHLAGSLRGGNFVDVQSDFTRARECDVASLWVRDYGIAEAGARTGAEVHHAFWQTNFFKQFAPQTGLGLFAPVQKSTGYAPAALGSKDVIEQEDATIVVND